MSWNAKMTDVDTSATCPCCGAPAEDHPVYGRYIDLSDGTDPVKKQRRWQCGSRMQPGAVNVKQAVECLKRRIAQDKLRHRT